MQGLSPHAPVPLCDCQVGDVELGQATPLVANSEVIEPLTCRTTQPQPRIEPLLPYSVLVRELRHINLQPWLDPLYPADQGDSTRRKKRIVMIRETLLSVYLLRISLSNLMDP
jgi:hypothetical protein